MDSAILASVNGELLPSAYSWSPAERKEGVIASLPWVALQRTSLD